MIAEGILLFLFFHNDREERSDWLTSLVYVISLYSVAFGWWFRTIREKKKGFNHEFSSAGEEAYILTEYIFFLINSRSRFRRSEQKEDLKKMEMIWRKKRATLVPIRNQSSARNSCMERRSIVKNVQVREPSRIRNWSSLIRITVFTCRTFSSPHGIEKSKKVILREWNSIQIRAITWEMISQSFHERTRIKVWRHD